MALTNTISTALKTSNIILEEMGRRGRKMVEEYYSVETISAKMELLYQWILKEREKPEFVY